MGIDQTIQLRLPLRSAARQDSGAAEVRGGLLYRLESWAWKLQQRGIERYLASSQDVFELESRIRDLHRGGRQLY